MVVGGCGQWGVVVGSGCGQWWVVVGSGGWGWVVVWCMYAYPSDMKIGLKI